MIAHKLFAEQHAFSNIRTRWILILLLLVSNCLGCNSSSSHQVAKVISPNGDLEALVDEINGGATTSFGYDVSVNQRKTGESIKLASLYGALRN